MKQMIELIWLVVGQVMPIRSPDQQRLRHCGPDADIPAAERLSILPK